MAKKVLRVADKPTLDEVKTLLETSVTDKLNNLDMSVSNVAPEYTLGDSVTVDDGTSNAISNISQNKIVAGDYIVSYHGCGTNDVAGRILAANSNYVCSFLIKLYNTKTKKQTEVFFTTHENAAESAMVAILNFYNMMSSRGSSFRYIYDNNTNEVFVYKNVANVSDTTLTDTLYLARFKVVNDTFELISCVVLNPFTMTVTSLYYKLSNVTYVPSLNKLFILCTTYYGSSSKCYVKLVSIDVSNFLLTGSTPTITTIYNDSGNSNNSDSGTIYAFGTIAKLIYHQENNCFYVFYPSYTLDSTVSTRTTITIKYAIFKLNSGITSATLSFSSLTRTIYHNKLKPSNNVRMFKYSETGNIPLRDAIWYKGYQYIICNERLYKLLNIGLTSDEITKFPFSPSCWKVDGDILTLYGFDDNSYLMKYEYDMSTMIVKCSVSDAFVDGKETYY